MDIRRRRKYNAAENIRNKDTLEIKKERYFRNKDTLRFMTDKKSQYRKLREFKAG